MRGLTLPTASNSFRFKSIPRQFRISEFDHGRIRTLCAVVQSSAVKTSTILYPNNGLSDGDEWNRQIPTAHASISRSPMSESNERSLTNKPAAARIGTARSPSGFIQNNPRLQNLSIQPAWRATTNSVRIFLNHPPTLRNDPRGSTIRAIVSKEQPTETKKTNQPVEKQNRITKRYQGAKRGKKRKNNHQVNQAENEPPPS